MLNLEFAWIVLVSCEKDSRGFYNIIRKAFGFNYGFYRSLSQEFLGISQNDLLDLLAHELSPRASDHLYFVADSEVMRTLEGVPEFTHLDKKSKQSKAVFAKLISPPNMHKDYVNQIWSNLNVSKRVAPILDKFERSLMTLQKEFPCPLNATLKPISKEYTLEDCKNNIGNLLGVLLTDIVAPANTLILGGKFDKAQYEKLKEACSYWLEEDSMTQKLKSTANQLNPDTILYDLHYAAVSFVRAFFRIFDVLVTLFSKHTIHETPGRNPVFKLPEPPISRRIAVLMKEFKHAMRDLEDVYHNTQQKNNNLEHR